MNNLIAQAAATPLADSIRLIPLTQGKFAIVDAADFEFLNQWKWQAVFKKATGLWYVSRGIRVGNRKRSRYMHHDLLPAPAPLKVDHRDGDGLNNRRSNLRLATHQQNLCNRGPNKNNKSGHKGVHWDQLNNNWRARICVSGKHVNLGSFVSVDEAANAYRDAAIRLHGEFANF